MKKKLGLKLFSIFLLLFFGLTIFYFSSQPPEISHKQSHYVVGVLENLNEKFDISDSPIIKKVEDKFLNLSFMKNYKSANGIIRKSAHFGIYMIFGISCSIFGYAFSESIIISFLLGISLPTTLAVFDEFNQSFVGRTSSILDILIDFRGAFLGSLIICILICIFKIIKMLINFIQYKKLQKT